MSRAEELDRYAELTEWIRELSCPQIEGIHSAEEYRRRFVRNYVRINELARSSRKILSEVLFPLLEVDRLLTDEETEDLIEFSDRLIDAVNIECVDVPLREMVIDRLLKDAEEKGDIRLLFKALDARIETCFFMMGSASLICDVMDVYSAYREKGLEAGERLLAYLDKEKFAALPDYKMKEIVLINSRYINAVIDDVSRPEPIEVLQYNIDAMKRALSLAEDPFFIDQASKYNWKNHIYRSLQGIAFMTEYMNESGVPQDMLEEVNRYTRQMVALWKQDKVSYGALCDIETLNQCMYRNSYLAGDISRDTFLEKTLSIIDGANEEDFSHDGNMNLIFSQTEYMMALDEEHLTEEQKANVTRMYRDIVRYVHRVPKVGSVTFLLVYLKYALGYFIEFEGGPLYRDLVMELLASVLPEVYIHSLGVAAIGKVLATRLFMRDAGRFEAVPGYPDGEAVAEFVFRAGMLHDVGKLMIAESVLTYSRDRFEEEEIIYRTGPWVGSHMLSRCESTKPYAEAVRAHHFDYDRKDAFTALFGSDKKESGTDVVSHILALANDLEWMTSEIRYGGEPGMTYDTFCDHAKKGSGSRYAPYVTELLFDDETGKLLRAVLDEERADIFRRTYETLKT